MKRIRFLAVSLAAALPLVAEVRSVPPPGVPPPAADRAALESGLARLSGRIQKLGWNPLAADVAIYEKAVRFALRYDGIFQDGRHSARQGTARRRAGEGGCARSWRSAVGQGDRSRGPRLCFEHRWQCAALRPRDSGVVLANHAAPLASGCVVPWPAGKFERSQFSIRARAQPGRIYPARRDRAASVRPLLQRQ